jgi:hypothetical protein
MRSRRVCGTSRARTAGCGQGCPLRGRRVPPDQIVEELDVRDEAGLVDELATEQLVEDTLQRPEVSLILDTDVPRKMITKVPLERIAVMDGVGSGAAGSGGNGNEYECTFGAARVPQEAGVVDSRVNVGDGRGSHGGNVNWSDS